MNDARASDRCRALLEQLSSYIDDELTPAERRALTRAPAPVPVLPDHGRQPEAHRRCVPEGGDGPAARRRARAGQGPHRHAARVGRRRATPYMN